MSIDGLHHIGVYTKDIDVSIKFYEEILGFERVWRGIVDHPTGKLDVAVIKHENCIVELVRPADLNRVAKDAGPVQHIALKVYDLEKLMREIQSKGVEFSFEGLEEIPTFWKGIRHAFLFGPSNERIELVEEMVKLK
jgi:lactoylglutathione lyase